MGEFSPRKRWKRFSYLATIDAYGAQKVNLDGTKTIKITLITFLISLHKPLLTSLDHLIRDDGPTHPVFRVILGFTLASLQCWWPREILDIGAIHHWLSSDVVHFPHVEKLDDFTFDIN